MIQNNFPSSELCPYLAFCKGSTQFAHLLGPLLVTLCVNSKKELEKRRSILYISAWLLLELLPLDTQASALRNN
jgi:hypothetical protein